MFIKHGPEKSLGMVEEDDRKILVRKNFPQPYEN